MKYGSYETVKGLAAVDGKAVFLAGDKTSEAYVAKVYYLDHYAGNDPQKLEKFNESFYSRVEAQKKAALGSQFVAPILQFGQDDVSAWYVTKLYQSSVEKLLASRVNLDSESLYNVLYSVVRGALDLKKICGRSHGNLLPGNILLATAQKNIKLGQVALTDPTAGDAAQIDEIELADLRAIGELLYRLIYPHETRDIDLQKVPVMPTSQRWIGLFGSHAEAWFDIFNKLLNRKLAAGDYTLDRLEADLLKVKPHASGAAKPKAMVTAVVAFVVIGIAVFLVVSKKSPPPQTVVSTPEKKPKEEVVSQEDVRKREEEAKAAEAKRAEEAKRFAEQKAVEQKVQEEARLQAEAETKARKEARKAEEAKVALEQKRQAEAAAAAETQRKLEEAAKKAAEKEREKFVKEAEAKRLEDDRKAKELAAELERREKERQEAARKAAEAEKLRKDAEARQAEEARKTKELAAELARREKEKEEATRRATEADRLRREAEARQREEERKTRELAARLEREQREKEAQARQIAALKENPPVREGSLEARPTATAVEATVSSTISKPRKGQRWINGLGMKFVPTGNLLFCVWETRRKDYEEFVKTARYDVNNAWKSVSFKQTSSHPVVNVSAGEAVSFCKWLTESERKKGLISDTQFYRLPTEAEWTSVNGKSDESTLFIWGNMWPPPAGVGNFSLAFSYDRFDFTAPVAQFQSNRDGLFDMIGNVWELCENGRDNVVARGGGWLTAATDQLQASYHLPIAATDRREDVGFRIVLETGN